MSVARSGDFEAVLSHGIGLAKRSPFHVFTLTRPSRVVIEIGTSFPTVLSTPATGLMDRLFAGPTAAEYASGLRLLRSKATGSDRLSNAGQVARVRLVGGCSTGGATARIADEISPTLNQFNTVDFVNIYDPAGHTEAPNSPSDSLPFCLEPEGPRTTYSAEQPASLFRGLAVADHR